MISGGEDEKEAQGKGTKSECFMKGRCNEEKHQPVKTAKGEPVEGLKRTNPRGKTDQFPPMGFEGVFRYGLLVFCGK